MARLLVEVWSDLVCPWCYIGKRRLDGALSRHSGDVEVVWRAYELDPSAPAVRDDGLTQVQRLAAKYRRTPEQAAAMVANVASVGAEDGLDLRFDLVRSGNTFDAHRAVRFAAAQGSAPALVDRLFRAHFTEGRALGDRATLVELASEIGLPGDALATALDGDAHAADVRADQQRARELGITGVPFFVLGGRLGVSGAQPADTLVEALAEARRLVTA